MANEDLPLPISRMSAVPGRIDPVRAPHGRARSSSRSDRVSRRIAFAVGAAMTLLVVIVSHGSAQTPPPNRNVTDSRLAVKINTALWSDLRFPGRQISVDTQDAGFQNASHFARVFRKLEGTASSRIRRRRRRRPTTSSAGSRASRRYATSCRSYRPSGGPRWTRETRPSRARSTSS